MKPTATERLATLSPGSAWKVWQRDKEGEPWVCVALVATNELAHAIRREVSRADSKIVRVVTRSSTVSIQEEVAPAEPEVA